MSQDQENWTDGAEPFHAMREHMVETQIESRGVRDRRVLAAMGRVPREAFVPEESKREAYFDHPLPIGHEQTISQPYIVALMTELAEVQPGDRVLEVGTGCGYQTAVLAELAQEVYSLEIVPELAEQTGRRLAKLGYANVQTRAGNGYAGWPDAAPFAAIVLTAAPPRVPKVLLEQLAEGGRLVAPEGGAGAQMLKVYRRRGKQWEEHDILPVRFVPMVKNARGEGWG